MQIRKISLPIYDIGMTNKNNTAQVGHELEFSCHFSTTS